jgi:hypothetical protein
MSLYTIVFILVAFLVLVGLALFGMFIGWLDKKFDKMDRLGNKSKKK